MLSGSFAAFEAERIEEVRIRFDALVRGSFPSANGTNRKRCVRWMAGLELTMRVGVAPDLESWILGWGDHAEVIEPGNLRERISPTIRSMAAKYQRPSLPA